MKTQHNTTFNHAILEMSMPVSIFFHSLRSQDAREQCYAVFMKKKGKLQNICVLE